MARRNPDYNFRGTRGGEFRRKVCQSHRASRFLQLKPVIPVGVSGLQWRIQSLAKGLPIPGIKFTVNEDQCFFRRSKDRRSTVCPSVDSGGRDNDRSENPTHKAHRFLSALRAARCLRSISARRSSSVLGTLTTWRMSVSNFSNGVGSDGLESTKEAYHTRFVR